MKTIVYQLLFPIFLFCLNSNCLCQISRFNWSYETVDAHTLFDWKKLYEFPAAMDSAIRWVDDLDLSMQKVTVQLLISQFGTRFYRLNKSTIINVLRNKFETENYYALNINTQKEFDTFPISKKALYKLTSTSIQSQIWDEKPRLTINYPNGYLFECRHRVGKALNALYAVVDSPNRRIIVPNLNAVINEIEKIKDAKLKIEILFYLLSKLHLIGASTQDMNQLAMEIASDSYGSIQGLEAATMFLGCAKILASRENYKENRELIYQFFTQAEGSLATEFSENLEYLKRITIIKGLFLNQWRGDVSRHYVQWVFDPENEEFLVHKLTKIDSFKRILCMAFSEIGYCYELINDGITVKDNEALKCLVYLNSINQYLKDSEVNSFAVNSEYYGFFLRMVSQFYGNYGDYEKSLKYFNKYIHCLLNSKNINERLDLYGASRLLAQIYRNKGELIKARNIYVLMDEPSSEYNSIYFYFPLDLRVWRKEHFEYLLPRAKHDHTLDADEIKADPERWRHRRLWKLAIAKYEASLGHWEIAYKLQLQADSIKSHLSTTDDKFILMIGKGEKIALGPRTLDFYMKLAAQSNIIISKTRTILYVSIGVGLLVILSIIVIFQWRRAKILSNYNRYKSNVWQEMGHIPGTSIDNLYMKLKKEGFSDEKLLPLIRLKSIIGGLFSSLVKGDDKIGNPLEDEIQLTTLYVDYKNATTNSFIRFTHDNPTNIKVPPALLLSCMRNAIEHGKLLGKKDAQIHLNIENHKTHYQLTVYNNGTQFKEKYLNKKNIRSSSTGFRNMHDVLTYFNRSRRIKNPVDWDNINYKIYKVQTQLKVKNDF